MVANSEGSASWAEASNLTDLCGSCDAVLQFEVRRFIAK